MSAGTMLARGQKYPTTDRRFGGKQNCTRCGIPKLPAEFVLGEAQCRSCKAELDRERNRKRATRKKAKDVVDAIILAAAADKRGPVVKEGVIRAFLKKYGGFDGLAEAAVQAFDECLENGVALGARMKVLNQICWMTMEWEHDEETRDTSSWTAEELRAELERCAFQKLRQDPDMFRDVAAQLGYKLVPIEVQERPQ